MLRAAAVVPGWLAQAVQGRVVLVEQEQSQAAPMAAVLVAGVVPLLCLALPLAVAAVEEDVPQTEVHHSEQMVFLAQVAEQVAAV